LSVCHQRDIPEDNKVIPESADPFTYECHMAEGYVRRINSAETREEAGRSYPSDRRAVCQDRGGVTADETRNGGVGEESPGGRSESVCTGQQSIRGHFTVDCAGTCGDVARLVLLVLRMLLF
jgi:hypothetical protein